VGAGGRKRRIEWWVLGVDERGAGVRYAEDLHVKHQGIGRTG
jgi:hypothetical protein